MLPRPIDTITLLGLGASIYDWVHLTHKEFDVSGEVWTINAGAKLFRHDIVFDMHTPEWLQEKQCERAIKRHEYLKTHDKPIYMPKARPDIPMSVTYPLRHVIEATNSCYFSNGLAYALAMAWCCDVKRLRMFGCDFSYDRNTNTHDEQGRACCEYWVGRLVAKNVKFEGSNNTHFLDMHVRSQGKIYGYHERVEFEHPADGSTGKFIGPNYVD